MATPKEKSVYKLKLNDPDLKKMIKKANIDKIRAGYKVTKRQGGRQGFAREMPTERYPHQEFETMANHTVNHCRSNGSGMSACYACRTYTDSGKKVQCQKACHFFQKHSFAEHCTWETYGEYCWSTKAQDDAKARGYKNV